MKKTSNSKRLIVIVLIMGLSFSAHAAEMYRWVDKEGVVHFSTEQPEGIQKIKQMKVEDSEKSSEVSTKIPETQESTVTTTQKKPVKDPRRVDTRTQKKLENFPLIFQKHNWCVIASMEMVFRYYGFDIDQDGIFQKLKGRRSTVAEGEGLDPRTAARFLSRSGFTVDYCQERDLDAIKKYIDNNVPILWGHRPPGKWDRARHMAVIIGYDDVYKELVVADPGYGREISVSYDEFRNQWQSNWSVLIAVSK
jgi:hypothetical protein